MQKTEGKETETRKQGNTRNMQENEKKSQQEKGKEMQRNERK